AEASPVEMADVETVREVVTDSLAGSFFGPRFDMATDAEQRYLSAMAALGDAPYRSADVAQRFGARDQRGVSVHRDALISKGLVWSPRRGLVDFTVPLFAEFVRQFHPITSYEESW
ncbi:MAG: ATP-binding protein, partial [Acidimicrobiia bacterium]